MRVAIIGNYPLDINRIQGGVQAAFAYLVSGLSQIHDMDVHVLTMGRQHAGKDNNLTQNGVTVHVLPVHPRFEFAKNYHNYQTSVNRVLAKIQPDVVHAQESTTHAYIALRSGYPTVITVHGIQREDIKHQGSLAHRMRNWLHNLVIERYNLKHTRHLIAISQYVVDYFSNRLRADIQVYHVPNAIDKRYFNLAPLSDGHTILFAGRVIPRKRVLDLVKAFTQIAPLFPLAQLRIAGEYKSEPQYTASVKDMISKAKLEDRIYLLGPLPEEAILHEFAACDVLVLPSAQETTPMVIAQAMAAGKPVVATAVGGVGEMVSHQKNGFLTQVGDINGLAESMLQLLQQPELRHCMGEAGRDWAMANYHVDTIAKRTQQVYQRVAVSV